MCVIVLFLVAIISVPIVTSASEWSCNQENYRKEFFDQRCEFEEYDKLGITIKLKDMKPKYLTVECTSQRVIHFSEFRVLKSLQSDLGQNISLVDLKSVTIKSCILPGSVCGFIRWINSSLLESSVSIRSNDTKSDCRLDEVSNIKEVQFFQTKMNKVVENLFEGLENLEYLDLTDNEIQTLPPGLFSHLNHLEFLYLGGNEINNLESSTFENLSQLKHIHISGNPLRKLPEQIFSGLNKLNVVALEDCALESLHSDLLSDLHQLTFISLHKNNFSTLPKDLFRATPLLETVKLFGNHQRLVLPSGLLSNLTRLEGVFLIDNKFSSVGKDLLRGLSSVRNVSLHRNALTSLPGQLFSDTSSLMKLDLSSNQLASLPADIFDSLVKLRVLDLSNNRLTTIPKYMFGRLTKLEELDLKYNELNYIVADAFDDSCILTKIDLSYNKLTFNYENILKMPTISSPLYKCRELKIINLANNSISQIFSDWKINLIFLSSLDLSNNDIQTLKFVDLEFNVNDFMLDLRNNRISHIQVDAADFLIFKTPHKKTTNMYLEGNPIRCDCSLYNFLLYIEEPMSSILLADASEVTCGDAAGQLVAGLTASHVTCDLPADCPALCTCRWRPHDGGFVVDCSGLGLRQPPGSLPWNDTWKYTELHLERNGLEALPSLLLPGYDRVAKLFASHNNVSKLSPENLSAQLQVLDLADNKLTVQTTRSVFEYLLKNKWTFENLTLDHNKWGCDCEARPLLNFLHSHRGKVDNVTCLDGRSLMPLSPEDICSSSHNLIVALSAVAAIVGILVGVVATLYYRYQLEVKVWLYAQHLCLWLVTEEEVDKDKEYDAFICYSHKDKEFVENFLVPGLEAGPHLFKLCLHGRDWIPGEWITTQITRSVKCSRRTVIVLSPNFLESVWGLVEFRTAHKQTMTDGRARVIILLYGDLGSLDTLDSELRGYLSMNTYITWNDPWFWKKMHYALPHPLHIAHAKNNLRRIKRKPLLKTLGTDSEVEGRESAVKDNTYKPTAASTDSKYDVNGYLGLLSTSPNIKTIEEVQVKKVMT